MKHKPSDYQWIKTWHEKTCSSRWYWERLQKEASDEGAPINAIYRDHTGAWRTTNDVTNMQTRERMGMDQ